MPPIITADRCQDSTPSSPPCSLLLARSDHCGIFVVPNPRTLRPGAAPCCTKLTSTLVLTPNACLSATPCAWMCRSNRPQYFRPCRRLKPGREAGRGWGDREGSFTNKLSPASCPPILSAPGLSGWDHLGFAATTPAVPSAPSAAVCSTSQVKMPYQSPTRPQNPSPRGGRSFSRGPDLLGGA